MQTERQQIPVRVSPDTHQALKARAAENGRSMTREIERILVHALQTPAQPQEARG